ncbi:programmed cell death protein, putative [Eimeria mitis]|uniref:Programmed cell death protein, putative n=1 Tax=Eimeria mitis TaxID=44415 RepID=U6JSY4_9EIME|nr:programmed cell death protein, putative [Eimeria mitis]CDJ27167.1 programmed cell death protein, putative [Eimeria mitis]
MSGEAPVFIGFLGDLVPDGDKTAAEALSKFGGQPVWIDGNVPESFPFICSHCGAELDFVCQIATPYCANKRCLYLFGCHKQTTCGKTADGWMVVRGVVEAPASAKVEKKLRDNLPEHRSQGNDALSSPDSSDWLQAAFGYTASASSCSDNGCRQSGKTCEPEAASSQKPGCTETPQTANELMPAFFVRIEDEPPDNSQFDATGVRARQLQLEYEQRNSIAEGEEYEESPDKVFLKLQKRLSRSPKQAIRYSFGGKPLFISPPKGKAASVPPCPHCGSDRVFEMQLVPAAAEEIEKRRHSAGAAPVEWGVVAVFTCRKDCIPSSIYTVEHVVAQEIL